MNEALLSSGSTEWSTPRDFFDTLNTRYGFTLDPCATAENALCKKFYTREDDGLVKSWKYETVFMNPPYGREIKHWIRKAYEESTDCLVVALIPARTDTSYWHQFILNEDGTAVREGVTVRFIKGRLKFGDSKNSAPFPSALVVFDRRGL